MTTQSIQISPITIIATDSLGNVYQITKIVIDKDTNAISLEYEKIKPT